MITVFFLIIDDVTHTSFISDAHTAGCESLSELYGHFTAGFLYIGVARSRSRGRWRQTIFSRSDSTVWTFL